MRNRPFVVLLVLIAFSTGLRAGGKTETPPKLVPISPQAFSWKQYAGTEIQFLANNNPVGQLLEKYAKEFTDLTGIKVTVSLFAEQQFRQRLQTIFQAKSDEVDVYMSLVSREGQLFRKAGWYLDLYPLLNDRTATSPDYNFADFGKGVANAGVLSGALTGIPVNIEGPVLYYRADILSFLGLAPPKNIEEIQTVAAKIKEGKPNIIPFASRGLAPALPYTFSNFLHNLGGEYVNAAGRSNLSSPEGIRAIEYYAKLLKDYGPPGVINYSFPQLTAVNSNGQCAMTFQSSNEFSKIMAVTERNRDLQVTVLPAGPGGSVPVVIGWQLSVSPLSKKQKQAWHFLQWATSKDMQVKLGLEGLAPPRTSVWETREFTAWLNEYPVRKQWAEALAKLSQTGSSVLAPQIILQPEARQFIGDAVGSVILGQATAAQAAEKADKLINELIDKSSKM